MLVEAVQLGSRSVRRPQRLTGPPSELPPNRRRAMREDAFLQLLGVPRSGARSCPVGVLSLMAGC
eukprot:7801113-Alexandrium_andersonii.AAC.1